jgi:WD40 repeat protein
VWVWNVATRQVEQTLEGHSSTVYSVAFSPDGERLASGSYDHTVRVWDVATGQVEQTLRGHSDEVGSVAFSPDSSKFHSFYSLDSSRAWVTQNGSKILYLPLDYRCGGWLKAGGVPVSWHNNRPGEVATKGSTLAIGADNGRVTIIIFKGHHSHLVGSRR